MKTMYDIVLPPELESWISTEVPLLPGWCSVDKARTLARCVLERPELDSVELGVFGGRSCFPMAMAHKSAGLGCCHGVDPWEKPAALEHETHEANLEWWARLDYGGIYTDVCRRLGEFGLSGILGIHRARSDDPFLLSLIQDGSVGVMHQDSNHNEAVNTSEVELWWPKMAPGSLWVFDDVGWSDAAGNCTTTRALEMIAERGATVVGGMDDWRVFRLP
jgi:hypothetical protein